MYVFKPCLRVAVVVLSTRSHFLAEELPAVSALFVVLGAAVAGVENGVATVSAAAAATATAAAAAAAAAAAKVAEAAAAAKA